MTRLISVQPKWYGAVVRVDGRVVKRVLTLRPDVHQIIRDYFREAQS